MVTRVESAIANTYKDEEFWSAIVENSSAQSGPFDGGCLICAKAILMAFGGDKLVRITSELNGGQTEHYGALVGGLIFDLDGPAENQQAWIHRFVENEQVHDRQCSYSEGYDSDSDIPDDPATVKVISQLLIRNSY